MKLRYDYTSHSLHTWAKTIFGSFSLAWWLMTGAAVALSIVGWPSIIPLITSCVIWLAVTLSIMFAWRATSRSLGSRSLFLTVPWFMTFEPIYNFYYRIKGYLNRGKNLSWN